MIRILIILIVVICVFLLQIVLSKMESRIPGLILPAVMILGYLPFMYAITGGPNVLWLVAVLPIALLLLVYFLCRRKSQKNQMEKMKIQDLE